MQAKRVFTSTFRSTNMTTVHLTSTFSPRRSQFRRCLRSTMHLAQTWVQTSTNHKALVRRWSLASRRCVFFFNLWCTRSTSLHSSAHFDACHAPSNLPVSCTEKSKTCRGVAINHMAHVAARTRTPHYRFCGRRGTSARTFSCLLEFSESRRLGTLHSRAQAT